jgi:DNA-binding transcriptional MerR regulator
MKQTFGIGRVAREAGVGIETVRFYERQGLLAEPERKASGYRQYDQAAIETLLFIKRAKELGFTLKEIKGLLALRLDAAATARRFAPPHLGSWPLAGPSRHSFVNRAPKPVPNVPRRARSSPMTST